MSPPSAGFLRRMEVSALMVTARLWRVAREASISSGLSPLDEQPPVRGEREVIGIEYSTYTGFQIRWVGSFGKDYQYYIYKII